MREGGRPRRSRRETQPENNPGEREGRGGSPEREERDEQEKKAAGPMEVTLLSIPNAPSKVLRSLQHLKAEGLMAVTLGSTVKEVREVKERERPVVGR